MRFFPSVLCLALALFVARCGGSADGSAAPVSAVGPTWQLVAISDGGDAALPAATLLLSPEGRASGGTDCNDFMGEYTLADDGALDFSGLATTRKACAPAAMTQEQRVLTALGAVGRAEVSDGQLKLLGESGTELLRFDVVSADPGPVLPSVESEGRPGAADTINTALAGPQWILTKIHPTGGTPQTPENDRPYTLTFGEDGRYTGEADCNTYQGEYRSNQPGEVSLQAGLSTLAACPPGSLADPMLQALWAADRYSVEGNELTLSGTGVMLHFALVE